MTLFAGALVSLLLSVIGPAVWHLGEVLQDRHKAQIAADAAALAAIAESGFYGTADPAGLARRFATLNGARLDLCECTPGATSVEVEVSVDGVSARARAAYDPTRLGPVTPGGQGLDPTLESAVTSLLAASNGEVTLVSGFRSSERQAALWAEALATYGSAERADDWVAPPGSSMHERGLAVDLGGDLDLAVDLIARLGLPLHRPLVNEPWHFELAGTRY